MKFQSFEQKVLKNKFADLVFELTDLLTEYKYHKLRKTLKIDILNRKIYFNYNKQTMIISFLVNLVGDVLVFKNQSCYGIYIYSDTLERILDDYLKESKNARS